MRARLVRLTVRDRRVIAASLTVTSCWLVAENNRSRFSDSSNSLDWRCASFSSSAPQQGVIPVQDPFCQGAFALLNRVVETPHRSGQVAGCHTRSCPCAAPVIGLLLCRSHHGDKGSGCRVYLGDMTVLRRRGHPQDVGERDEPAGDRGGARYRSACGEAGQDSDIDLLVEAPEGTEALPSAGCCAGPRHKGGASGVLCT